VAKIISQFKDKIIDYLVATILGGLAFLFGVILKSISPKLINSIPKNVLFATIGILLLIAICLLTVLLIRIKENRKLSKFGLKWDKSFNAHCPACESLLSEYSQYNAGYGFHCIKCNRWISIYNEDGASITLKQAQESIKNLF